MDGICSLVVCVSSTGGTGVAVDMRESCERLVAALCLLEMQEKIVVKKTGQHQ